MQCWSSCNEKKIEHEVDAASYIGIYNIDGLCQYGLKKSWKWICDNLEMILWTDSIERDLNHNRNSNNKNKNNILCINNNTNNFDINDFDINDFDMNGMDAINGFDINGNNTDNDNDLDLDFFNINMNDLDTNNQSIVKSTETLPPPIPPTAISTSTLFLSIHF